MDLIKQFSAQAAAIWGRWDRFQRIGIVSAVFVCICGMLIISMWASSQQFVTLSNHLTPATAHEIVSTLESEGIEYQLNFSGSAVSVPVSRVSEARIALRDVAPNLDEDPSETGPGFGADPTQQRSHQQRSTERRLAASIARMQAVRSATVHISSTEQSPFVRDRNPAKASVVLELVSGRQFSATDARAIVSLVSHAVENLDPENTMIVDTAGNVLSGNDSIGGDVADQLEFRRKLESDLAAKAEAMLAPILGDGHAIVRVTADVDFTEKNTARTTYDPDTKVKTREMISTETTHGLADRSGSETGTASNFGGPGANSASGQLSETEKIETDYQNTEIVDTIREAPGKLIRLTVAAVVELPEAGATGADQKMTAITKEQIEGIIRQAVGFDEGRNDEIEVLAAQMTDLPDITAPAGWVTTLEQLAPFARSISLGLASVIALILGVKVIGRLKPVVVQVGRSETLDPEVRARLADLSEDILKHPGAVSTVLADWLAERNQESDGAGKKSRKAA